MRSRQQAGVSASEQADRLVAAATPKVGLPIASGTAPAPPNPPDAPKTDPAPLPEDKTPPLWATAHGRVPGVSPNFARIIETMHVVDVRAEYNELDQLLEVGEQRGDRGTLREFLDKAEKCARRAHKLLLEAKVEKDRWEGENLKVRAAMRHEARKKLEDEKAQGERRKQITNDDLDDQIMVDHPDEWAHQRAVERRLKNLVDDIEDLVARWNSRCFTLRTLLEQLR